MTGCAALASLSIALSCREVGMATLWYANAFGACCLLGAGRRDWWVVLAALAGGLLAANGLAGADPGSAVRYAVPNLSEMVLGGWLLTHSPYWRQIHRSPLAGWQVWWRAVLLPALCGATLAVPLLSGTGVTSSSSAVHLWLTWFEGSLIGTSALLPLGLSLRMHWSREGVGSLVRHLVTGEAVALMALSLGTAALALPHLPFPFVYLGLPMLAAAVRLRYLDVVLQVWLVSLAA
ncbi:MAG: hypothetical protein AB3X43_04710, partial [Sphaerotilus sp.]